MSTFAPLQPKSHTNPIHAHSTLHRSPFSRPASSPAHVSDQASPGQQRQPQPGPRSRYSLADLPLFPSEKEVPTGLPNDLKASIEHLSGISMDDVKVHYHSYKPAQVHALAYTQGTNIYIAPGQERHLSHEAWHVVQQKQGRVPTLSQAKGRAINTDRALEKEAEVIGERTKGLLNSTRALLPHGRKGPNPPSPLFFQETPLKTLGKTGLEGMQIQRKVSTTYGEFETQTYVPQKLPLYRNTRLVGANLSLSFKPHASIREANVPIGLVQSVQTQTLTPNENQPGTFIPVQEKEPIKQQRTTPKDIRIDQNTFANSQGKPLSEEEATGDPQAVRIASPLYHVSSREEPKGYINTYGETRGKREVLLSNAKKPTNFGQIYSPDKPDESAELHDMPLNPLYPQETITAKFEVAALTLLSPHIYLGSVRWGYKGVNKNKDDTTKDENGENVLAAVDPESITKLSDGEPTEEFIEAAQFWNKIDPHVQLPIPDPKKSKE